MKRKDLAGTIGAGLVALAVAGVGGCASDMMYHPGFPPRVVREDGERTGKNWKQEGAYEYMERVYFEGRWYTPTNLDNALQIQEKLRQIDAQKSFEFLKEHGFPRD